MGNYCMYCLKAKEEVAWLQPIYNWTDGKQAGYFCDEHYEQVEADELKAKAAYERQRKQTEGIWDK